MSENQHGVNSVYIASHILEFIASQGGCARATDIAKGCGLSKSRLHKYLISFCHSGTLIQDENGHYCLGETLIRLASAVPGNQDILTIINPVLSELRDKINYSTCTVIATSKGLILRHYHRSYRNVDIDVLDNTPIPIDTSAAGMILMSYGSWLPSGENMQQATAQIRHQGYAVRHNPTDGIPGVQSIAAPILDKAGKLLAIGAIIGFFSDMSEIEQLATELKQAISSLQI